MEVWRLKGDEGNLWMELMVEKVGPIYGSDIEQHTEEKN